MRSPSLHFLFGTTREPGLSNYLAGESNIDSMLHQGPNGLWLLPAGPIPPNAAELLTGDRFQSFLKELSSRFDHVVIDAPPVMGLADTPLIASVAEGTVFVVESHATSASLAQAAVSRLRDSRAKLLGALLTKFEPKRAQYGYGYEYGYGYGKDTGESSNEA
jgi:capsular exopolysaccharide synthesis family protein